MGKSTKLPAMPFYTGDWRKDPNVQSMDYELKGVWFEILCLMWESEERGKLMLNGKAMPESAIARLLGLDNQKVNLIVNQLVNLFGVACLCPDTKSLMSRRMVKDEDIRKIRRKAGSKGGNPKLLPKNKAKDVLVNQKDNLIVNHVVNQSINQIPETETEYVFEDESININKKESEVFSHWKNVFNHPKAKFDKNRCRIITAALKTYSTGDLLQAVDGCSKTPHNIGNSDSGQVYDGIHIIFKDSENIERFMRNAANPPRQPQAGKIQRNNFEQTEYKEEF